MHAPDSTYPGCAPAFPSAPLLGGASHACGRHSEATSSRPVDRQRRPRTPREVMRAATCLVLHQSPLGEHSSCRLRFLLRLALGPFSEETGSPKRRTSVGKGPPRSRPASARAAGTQAPEDREAALPFPCAPGEPGGPAGGTSAAGQALPTQAHPATRSPCGASQDTPGGLLAPAVGAGEGGGLPGPPAAVVAGGGAAASLPPGGGGGGERPRR